MDREKLNNLLLILLDQRRGLTDSTLNYRKEPPLVTAGKRAHTERIHDDGMLLLDLVKNISPLLFLDVVKLELNEKEIIIKNRC